jgi:NAD dependent epimerase/dehydratase family enzyme
MTGASGFVGRYLADFLRARGHVVAGLSRLGSDPMNPTWHLVGECDAVVHLAGENIAQRWNET